MVEMKTAKWKHMGATEVLGSELIQGTFTYTNCNTRHMGEPTVQKWKTLCPIWNYGTVDAENGEDTLRKR